MGQRFAARYVSGNPLQVTYGVVLAGMNGIPSTRAEFVRIASSNGRRRSAIAAKDGRLTKIGMCTGEHIELKSEDVSVTSACAG